MQGIVRALHEERRANRAAQDMKHARNNCACFTKWKGQPVVAAFWYILNLVCAPLVGLLVHSASSAVLIRQNLPIPHKCRITQ
jgi:hypothetical protein